MSNRLWGQPPHRRVYEFAVRTRRQRYSGGAGEQGTPVRNRRDALPAKIRQPGNNDMDNAERDLSTNHIDIPTSSRASPNVRKTTQEDRSRKRMRWNEEMNLYLYRTYLVITRMETSKTPYSVQLHNEMIQKFPELHRKTIQNILDQRRQLFTKNRIPPETINKIRRDVAVELGLQQIEQADEEQINNMPLAPEATTTRTNTEANHPHPDEFLVNMLNTNYHLYSGMDLKSRNKLPKLKFQKNTNSIVTSCNELLKTKLNQESTLEEIADIIYIGAITVLQANDQTITPTNNNNTNKKKLGIPPWMRRITNKIKDIRIEIGILTQRSKGNKSKKVENKSKVIMNKYLNENNKSITDILDYLKQQLAVKANRLKRYNESYQRRKQNSLFKTNQKHFYKTLEEKEHQEERNEYPTPDQIKQYWESIWATPTTHTKRNQWMKEEKTRTNKIEVMICDSISLTDVQEASKKLSNWKAPGADGIQNFWIKKFTSTHEHLAHAFSKILTNPDNIPTFLTQGTTYLLPKSTPSSQDPSKYRPITCLPTIYKLLTSILTQKIYNHLEMNQILAEEQKGCRKFSQGCKEQITIDSIITQEARKKNKDLYIAYIDYQKAFDSVPHSWLLEILNIYKVNIQIISLLEHLMTHWETDIIMKTKDNALNKIPIKINRGIFQGDSLSALWFCIALNPLSYLLRNTNCGYQLDKGNTKFSHLIYMDDIKLFAQTEKELKRLLQVTDTFSRNIKMDFGIEKCKINGMRRGKWERPENYKTTQPPHEEIKSMDKDEQYKYLGMNQNITTVHADIKTNLTKKMVTRVKSILKSKLSAKHKVLAVNTFAAPVITYSFGIIKWTKTDLEELNRKLRVLFTRYRDHHPRSSMERFHLPRHLGGRGVVDFINAHYLQVSHLRTYFNEKSEENTAYKELQKADKDYTPLKLSQDTYEPLTQQITNQDKIQKWKEKPRHGKYIANINKEYIDAEATHTWLTHSNMFSETEGFILAIQDRVISTRSYKRHVIKDHTVQDRCRMCNKAEETIEHLISGCEQLSATMYTQRHDNIAKIIHQHFALIIDPSKEEVPYYKYNPENVTDTPTGKLYWNRIIYTDHHIRHNKPDILYINKRTKHTQIIDIAVPHSTNVEETRRGKINKYTELARELQQIWDIETTEIIPIIVGATGEIPRQLFPALEKIGMPKNTFMRLQKSALLDTCRIVRSTLNITTRSFYE